MMNIFTSPLAEKLDAFLAFKRNLGFRYARAEFTLRAFDGFLFLYIQNNRSWRLDRVFLAWLANKPKQSKAVSVSMDIAILRQFCKFLRRLPGRAHIYEPVWPRLPTTSTFTPYVLSIEQIRRIIHLANDLDRGSFRKLLYRVLLLVLYCTGIRFGEALRLRIQDVDIQTNVLFISESKGRSRWVPFRRSLSRELEIYLRTRKVLVPASPTDRFFIGVNRLTLPVSTASETIRRLYCKAGLKPSSGRVGPRPYDLRHTFAVHRLTRWYYQHVDLHARLPWLSAYMGHDDILGTETYLTATPELLNLAGDRFRHRYLAKGVEKR